MDDAIRTTPHTMEALFMWVTNDYYAMKLRVKPCQTSAVSIKNRAHRMDCECCVINASIIECGGCGTKTLGYRTVGETMDMARETWSCPGVGSPEPFIEEQRGRRWA